MKITFSLVLGVLLSIGLNAQNSSTDSIPDKPLMQKAKDSKMHIDPYKDGVAPPRTTTDGSIPMPPLPPPPEEREIFVIVEKMPMFPGCTGESQEKRDCAEKAFSDFIYENLTIPEGLSDDLGDHKVLVRLVVEASGNLSDAVLLRGSSSPMVNNEVLRVVDLLPNFEPGLQRGRPVPVYFRFPVYIKVED